MSNLAQVIADAEVVVCCGTGGVGKTTTAAALGLEAARLGRRAVVVTIDPAKRLADALGVPQGLTNDPIRLPVAAIGELWALMLDPASTFDGLVMAHSASPDQAERILANGFYRSIAGSLSGTQEYMAAERLHALHVDARFDVVIVDTPPTRHALDFLDAPGTLTRFIDHPLFRLMMAPTRRGFKVLNLASQPILRTIGKVVGGDVLADAVAFFQAFSGMETGFRRRAEEVMTLLRSDVARFVLVASPRRDTLGEATYFADRLADFRLAVAALVVNRATPDFADLPGTGTRSKDPAMAPLVANLAELRAAANGERAMVKPVEARCAVGSTWVPLLAADVHDMVGLERIRALLFDAATSSR